MIFKRIVAFLFLAFFLNSALYASQQKAGESDQQINDFSLTGFAEKGKRSWDISGKSADIYNEIVDLEHVTGNLYGEKEDIRLSADRGAFDRKNSRVRLRDNVVITTSSNTRLTTDSLLWDRKKQFVFTKDPVNITRDNMVVTAEGAMGRPDLKKIHLKKKVKVDIDAQDKANGKDPDAKKKVVITCSGALVINYEKNLATFNKDVKVDTQDMLIYSDTMDVYFLKAQQENAAKATAGSLAGRIEKIIAKGNVKIIKGENTSYSEEAIYTEKDRKLTLIGSPRLIIYSTEELNASFGNQKPL